jgi:hypothetical protein
LYVHGLVLEYYWQRASQKSEQGHEVQGAGSLAWPEVATAAMAVVRALEQLSHDSLGTDLHKYNLKMRQLDFNVKVSRLCDANQAFLQKPEFHIQVNAVQKGLIILD